MQYNIPYYLKLKYVYILIMCDSDNSSDNIELYKYCIDEFVEDIDRQEWYSYNYDWDYIDEFIDYYKTILKYENETIRAILKHDPIFFKYQEVFDIYLLKNKI